MLSYGKTGTAPGTTTITLGAVPTDFEVSKAHLNYLRFYHGWVPGQLGQTTTEAEAERLALEREKEAIAYHRTLRTWMIIGGCVGLAGLVVSIVSLMRK